MSKRLESQEVEAFSSLQDYRPSLGNPFEASSALPHQQKRNCPASPLANPKHYSASSSHQPTYENGYTHITVSPPPERDSSPNPGADASARPASAKPLSVVSGIFTCWSKTKEKSGSIQHSLTLSRHPLNKLSPPILLDQTRLQQEALAETQDTRDMWEWQMEQQQDLTTQEHTLLERNCVENPLQVLPELMSRNNSINRSINSTPASLRGHTARTDSSNTYELGKEGVVDSGDEVNDQKISSAQGQEDGIPSSNIVATGSESPTWDLHNPLASIWRDAELVSAMMLLFESALLRCRAEVAFFCRVYMQQMVLSGYALIRTLMEMEPNTIFARKVHASYAIEAHVNAVMFQCFESDSFDKSGVTHILDPGARAAARVEEYVRMKGVDAEEALRAGSPAYEEAFHSFCVVKSEEIMSMFSWMRMGYRSAAERDRFMEAFLRAAKWVWLLHRLANSTHPPMHIFRVGPGHVIDPAFVESVSVPSIGTCPKCPPASPPKVEFMIMPGFLSPSRKIFRCKAYQHYMCKSN